MRKKKLGELPEDIRITPLNDYKWTIEASLTDVSGEQILIINIYLKNNITPNYRQFISKTEYVTQDIQTDKPAWRTGRLAHYISYPYWQREFKGVYVLDKFKDMICDFIGIKDDDVMNAINRFQDNILQSEIVRKEKLITDPIDALMEKEIKDLPEDWTEWLIDDVFVKSRYIYYKYTGKVKVEGYCTHCNTDVTIYKPKHNQSSVCPNCGSNIIYKAAGKSTKLCDRRNVAILQETSEGFVIRYFDYYREYGRYYKLAGLKFNETHRDFIDKDLARDGYEHSMFKNKYYRWNKSTYNYYYHNNYNVYPYNIAEIIKDTKLKYSALDKLAGNKKDFAFNIGGITREYRQENLILEQLIKVGLYNLAGDLISQVGKEINLKEKKLNKKLGIEHDDIKILIEADVNYRVLDLFKALRKEGKRLTAEQLKEIIEQNYRTDKIENILRYVPVIKALRYLRELPASVYERETFYSDYLESCKKLKQDIKNSFVLYPKDLKKAHDVNVELVNIMNNKKKYKEHNSKYSAIKKMKSEINRLFSFQDDKFLIRAPEDAAEIVKEGQSLHHCVGGGYYSERMAKGSIAILFLRDKENPDVSYYTLEVDRKTNEVKQLHGYKNMDSDKDRINKFMKKFKKEKLKIIESETA